MLHRNHIVDRMLEEGHEVTAVDNLSEGHLENVVHLKGDRRFKFVELDLKDAKATGKVVGGSDVTFNMVAQARFRRSVIDHGDDLRQVKSGARAPFI